MSEHVVAGMPRVPRGRRLWVIAAAAITAFALVASGCGGGDEPEGSGSSSGEDPGKPVQGGDLVYGIEAETANGWCLPEGQLAISGLQVARAIYDTLTIPDADGEYVPYLAESVESNPEFTEWTIKLRDGITFHDGSALDATVVKNNIDAWRGKYPARKSLLTQFVYTNVAAVDVVDDLTVKVTTSTPWVSFASYLYFQGRTGIMGQAQLDDKEHCDENLIGTGPFKKEEWVVNDHFTATRNENYWRTDADGNQLPYLDSVEFRPFVDGDARVNALLSGQIQAMQTSGAPEIVALEEAEAAGEISVVKSGEYPDVSYGLLNVSKPPFNDPLARQAAAAAVDLDEIQKVINLDKEPSANGPFGPGSMGYLEDTGIPQYDPERAKELVAEYERESGKPLEFTFTVWNNPAVVATAQLVQEQAKRVGVTMHIEPVEQATMIARAIAGDFQALAFQNHPGGDPDQQYVWWHGGAITNFNKFKDPEIDALLEEGRAEPDPAKRKEIYEAINREFAKEIYNIWLSWNVFAIGTATNVHGVMGAPLPDGQEPFPGLADGHSLDGIWMSD